MKNKSIKLCPFAIVYTKVPKHIIYLAANPSGAVNQ